RRGHDGRRRSPRLQATPPPGRSPLERADRVPARGTDRGREPRGTDRDAAPDQGWTMSRVLTSPAPARPAALTRDPVQMPVVVAATALLALGTAWLAARYGARQAVLFLVGGALGPVLHHASFDFPPASRALVTAGDGLGVRPQLLMLATASLRSAPALAPVGV